MARIKAPSAWTTITTDNTSTTDNQFTISIPDAYTSTEMSTFTYSNDPVQTTFWFFGEDVLKFGEVAF